MTAATSDLKKLILTLRSGNPQDLASQLTPEQIPSAKHWLVYYGTPRLARLLNQANQAGPPQDLSFPPNYLLLYKHPMPGESQAKLAYEYVFERLGMFLEKNNRAVIDSSSPGHLRLWFADAVPDNPQAWLQEQWEGFLQQLTSPQSFRESFALALNSAKLASGAGFATLETPFFNAQHAQSLAGLYWVALQKGLSVNRRDFQTAQELEQAAQQLEAEAQQNTDSSKAKKLHSDAAKKRGDGQEKLKKATSFLNDTLRFVLTEIKQTSSSTAQVLSTALRACNNDLAQLPSKLLELYPSIYQNIIQAAKSYGPVAKEQINSARSDIFAKLIWELVRLAHGDYATYQMPPLLSVKAFASGVRPAGDANGLFCYSCGNALNKKEATQTFHSRRLLFESPEQRAQSASSSGPVKVCATCAGLSLLGPVKITSESLVIRIVGRKSSLVETVREMLERQVLSELGASAGNYINLLATERDKKQNPAPQVWGRKQYAIAKLALLLPQQVFEQSQADIGFVLLDKGNTVAISQAALLATATLARITQQDIRVGGDLNQALAKAVRYFDKQQWLLGEYTLIKASKGLPDYKQQSIDEVRGRLVNFMDATQAEYYKSVVAYATLLFAFTERAQREMKELKAEDREREMSKLLQISGTGSPIALVNRALAAGKSKSDSPSLGYSTARLYFDERFAHSYEWALQLSGKAEQHEASERGTSRFFEVSADDLIAVQVKLQQLFASRPSTSWKDFHYQVKLYLFTRYPKLMQG